MTQSSNRGSSNWLEGEGMPNELPEDETLIDTDDEEWEDELPGDDNSEDDDE